MTSSNLQSSFTTELESRIASRADELEEIHMEAAIDAQLTRIVHPDPTVISTSSSVVDHKIHDNNNDQQNTTSNTSENDEEVMFDDYTNPNSVRNCLSPFVPTSCHRIDAFVDLTNLKREDVVLDIGCGDGRVCVAVSKMVGCQSVGIDVSPPCISMAREVAAEEGLNDKENNSNESSCVFFEADATIDPDVLLHESSLLANALKSVTVIFLYTYPTLLVKLIPLLSRLTNKELGGQVRAIVTLTYHLPEDQVVCEKVDEEHNIHLYSRVFEK